MVVVRVLGRGCGREWAMCAGQPSALCCTVLQGRSVDLAAAHEAVAEHESGPGVDAGRHGDEHHARPVVSLRVPQGALGRGLGRARPLDPSLQCRSRF